MTTNHPPIRDVETLSQIECLPIELAWKVLEYAPESVDGLRQSSRLLKSRVDAYATFRRLDINIVEELNFHPVWDTKNSERINGIWKQSETIYPLPISIFIPKNKSTLFDLRLKFHDLPISVKGPLGSGKSMEYKLYLGSEDGRMIELLRENLGKKVASVSLLGSHYQRQLPLISTILNGIKFGKIQVRFKEFSDNMADLLLTTIKDHNVESLTLQIERNTTSDKVGFLLELSSLVRSLRLVQHAIPQNGHNAYFEFGMEQADWPSTILEMFSRKMDKLDIDTHNNPRYLGHASVDTLKKQLLRLKKKVWFRAKCNQDAQKGNFKYENEEHIVRGFVGPIFAYQNNITYRPYIFTVIHSSRVEEKCAVIY